MKALVWNGKPYPNGFQLKEVKKPKVKADWVLIKNKAAGICGSDVHMVLNPTYYKLPKNWFPMILGHEIAGVVVETGEKVTEFRKGDRVAVEPLHGCLARDIHPMCKFCRVGLYHLCPNLVHVGTYYPGGYGEYSVAHKSKLYKISDDTSFEEASILDTLAVAVHAVNVGTPSLNDTVAVIGCGTIGLQVIQCLKVIGVHNIIGVAKYSWQTEVAHKVGAKNTVILEKNLNVVDTVKKLTDGLGVDQAYDCVGGNTDAAEQCIEICRPGGKVVIVGAYSGNLSINFQHLLMKEIKILPSWSYSIYGIKNEFEIALELLEKKAITHKLLITHKFKLDDWKQAWEAVLNKEKSKSIKVLWTYE